MKTSTAVLVLCVAFVATAHAGLPSQTTAKSDTQVLQPPQATGGGNTDAETTTANTDGKVHTMEFEDTDEYVFLVCVRKLLKGPKGFCEREDVKAILPDLEKVPKAKPQPPEEVFESHRDGEATVFTKMLAEKRAEQLFAKGEKQKTKVWHKGASIAKALGTEKVKKLMADFLNSPVGKEGGAVVASVSAGDNLKDAAKKTGTKHAAKAKFRSQLGKVHHDLSLIERSTTKRSTADMVTPYKKPWKNAVVHYEFEGVGPTQRATLYGLYLEAIYKYQNNTCVRFEPKQVGTAHFTTLAGGTRAEGSFSRGLGNTSSRVQIAETMTDQKVVDHEFGHLLGLLHTNKRQDRDGYVDVNRTKCDNFFRKYVKRQGGFQLRCQAYYKHWKANGWIQLSGGFHDTWHNAPKAGIKAAWDAFDAALPQAVRNARTDMNAKLATYNGMWNLGILNRGRRNRALQAYNDAKDLYDLLVADLAEWEDIKVRAMQSCLDGWFYQYEQDPTATDHGNYDYRSIMHYPFNGNQHVDERCMMPKVPNTDGTPIPPNVGSYSVNNNDYAAVRANLGCQSSLVYVCRGRTTNCPTQAMRSMHKSWNMKDTMEILQSDFGFEIPAQLEKKEGGAWSVVNFQPTDTLDSLDLVGKPLRICDGCGGGAEESGEESSGEESSGEESSGEAAEESSSSD